MRLIEESRRLVAPVAFEQCAHHAVMANIGQAGDDTTIFI